MKKVVITGASGFIGKSLTAYFQRHGIPYMTISHNRLSASVLLEDVQAKLLGELKVFKPDTFIHLAWRVEANKWEFAESQREFINTTYRFLELLKECGIKQTIGIGSCLEYESSFLPISEHSPENRGLQYTLDKLTMKEVFDSHANTHGYINSWVRFFYIYGPNDVSDRLIPRVAQLTSQHEDVSLKNPFLNLDYLYIEDAAEAVVTIARKRHGGTINVGSGISVTPREITDQIRNLRNSNSKIIDLQNSRIKTKGYISDNSLLRSLGWAQKVSLEEGLRKFLSYN